MQRARHASAVPCRAQAEQGHVHLQHAVLGFWETAVAMPTDYDLPFVVPPSQYIVYHLALSPHAFAVARVCAVLERCVSFHPILLD